MPLADPGAAPAAGPAGDCRPPPGLRRPQPQPLAGAEGRPRLGGEPPRPGLLLLLLLDAVRGPLGRPEHILLGAHESAQVQHHRQLAAPGARGQQPRPHPAG